MKTLVKKNANNTRSKTAQCCAKTSKTTAGCHD